MRKVLSPNEIIVLKNGDSARRIKIGQMIGDGATCIAYEAERITETGAMLRCRVKECYPFGARIVREGVLLCWEDEDEKVAAFKRMKDAHELLSQLRNDETVGNSITSAELFEGNGTIYSVMELNHASTYESDKSTSLPEILDTMRVLTEVVGKIHRQGYLHLDIKPSNFLVSHNPSTWVWLFDVDSLTSLEELNRGAVHSVPYSQSWAAPEQFCGNITKICPATDIFAIGAILFEKIMGRRVTNDDMSLFAEWNFDIDILRNVNPKIKRCLAEIFRKTLSASVKRRCQTADELVCLLENAKKVSEETVYLVSNCPPCTSYFQGRTAELQQIHDCFESGQKVVFLHGFGGIGKSELAKKYAETYANSYDAILFLRYKDSLEELICEIDIQNVNEDNKTRMKVLKRLLTPRILLIIDNFDVEIGQDQYLAELLRFNSKILFTTRTDFAGVYTGTASQIEVEHLDTMVLKKLFLHHCRRKEFLPKEQNQLQQLFALIEHHTLAAELLAKQMWASGWSIETVLKKMEKGLSSFVSAEKVVMAKDEFTTKSRIPDIIRTVFQLTNLNSDQQQCLRNLFMLSFLYVDAETYRHFACSNIDNCDTLNELVELGWVRKNLLLINRCEQMVYSIHPLVQTVVISELKPTVKNCPQIADTIKTISPFDDFCFPAVSFLHRVECARIEQEINIIQCFVHSLDCSDIDNMQFAVWLIDDKIVANYHLFGSSLREGLLWDNAFCLSLYTSSKDYQLSEKTLIPLYKILLLHLLRAESCAVVDDGFGTYRWKNAFIDLVKQIVSSNADDKVEKVKSLCQFLKKSIGSINEQNMLQLDITMRDDLSCIDHDIANVVQAELFLHPKEDIGLDIALENDIEPYSTLKEWGASQITAGSELSGLVEEVFKSTTVSTEDKASLLVYFFHLYLGKMNSKAIRNDLTKAQIVDFESTYGLLQTFVYSHTENLTATEWTHVAEKLLCYPVKLSLILRNEDSFLDSMLRLKEYLRSPLLDGLYNGYHVVNYSLKDLVSMCSVCRFSYKMLVILVEWVEELDFLHEKQYIELYELIVECSEKACTEQIEGSEQYNNSVSIMKKYSQIVDEIYKLPFNIR